MKDERLKYLNKDSARAIVMACRRCGSLAVDQNLINELRCFRCGNISFMNGVKFAALRIKGGIDADNLEERDIELAFMSPNNPPPEK